MCEDDDQGGWLSIICLSNAMSQLRVLHIITGLRAGGAENMLLKIITVSDRATVTHGVISLTDDYPMGNLLRERGVPVDMLGMAPGRLSPRGVQRLGGMLRQFAPDVVSTWLHHADLVGGGVARLTTDAPVVWNLGGSVDGADGKFHSHATVFACGLVSRVIPERIVSCSHELVRWHGARGYDASRAVVIPNGFDTDAFSPNSEARRSVREELGLPESTLLVGLVARWAPQKDHATFFHAAAALRSSIPDVRYVVFGQGVDRENRDLIRLLGEAGVADVVFPLGLRRDVARLTAALDVAVSSSAHTEGFPNTLGEAMSCGVPCVATNVADAPYIIGDTGFIVPTRSPSELAEAVLDILMRSDEERQSLGRRARARVLDKFSLKHVADKYVALWTQLAEDRRRKLKR
jgi:glycosyltransferase involved in cell wall biosynthesis